VIAGLSGTLKEKSVTSSVVDVAGVGYLVAHSLHTFEELPAVGQPIELLTHLHVREDALQLYGFSTARERRLFELLLGISGVGPRVALAVLSGIVPDALVRAVAEENLAALTCVPGVGRKTAERILIELRDKVTLPAGIAAALAAGKEAGAGGAGAGGKGGDASAMPQATGSGPLGSLPGRVFEDAVAALVALGLTQAQAIEAVRRATEQGPPGSVEELVRRALAGSSSRTNAPPRAPGRVRAGV
jgi:Holliday junction DNA helicase RuvA